MFVLCSNACFINRSCQPSFQGIRFCSIANAGSKGRLQNLQLLQDPVGFPGTAAGRQRVYGSSLAKHYSITVDNIRPPLLRVIVNIIADIASMITNNQQFPQSNAPQPAGNKRKEPSFCVISRWSSTASIKHCNIGPQIPDGSNIAKLQSSHATNRPHLETMIGLRAPAHNRKQASHAS